ncbi:MAG: GNAT family N-acetyltransferase [Actinomycetota bacterium]
MSFHIRSTAADDLDAVLAVVQEQDVRWWGQVEIDQEEFDQSLDQVRRAAGSVAAGSCVATVGDDIVGFAARLGHGHTMLAAREAHDDARLALVDWLLDDVDASIDATPADVTLVTGLEQRGLTHYRSSFELERGLPIDDLAEIGAPTDVRFAPFDLAQRADVYRTIYSVWTDVDGHTARDFDEWYDLLVDYPSFDPRINVVAERRGEVVGAAMCRLYPGPAGWVSQLAVARAAQGGGIGRALLVEAFRQMVAHHEVNLLGLGAEAQNANALGLYRSVGLEVTREWRYYARRPREASAETR